MNFINYFDKVEVTLGVKVLLILMACDILIGSFRAIKTKRDKKGNKQGIDSMKGTIGLLKKGGVLTMLLVSYCLDLLFNSHFVFEATCFYSIFLELVSLKENYEAIGMNFSPALDNAMNMVEAKGNQSKDEKGEKKNEDN